MKNVSSERVRQRPPVQTCSSFSACDDARVSVGHSHQQLRLIDPRVICPYGYREFGGDRVVEAHSPSGKREVTPGPDVVVGGSSCSRFRNREDCWVVCIVQRMLHAPIVHLDSERGKTWPKRLWIAFAHPQAIHARVKTLSTTEWSRVGRLPRAEYGWFASSMRVVWGGRPDRTASTHVALKAYLCKLLVAFAPREGWSLLDDSEREEYPSAT